MQRELIKDLAEQIRGVSYKPEDLHKDLNENSVILLRANNIDDGMINFDDVVYVDKSKVSKDQYLKTGDILICASSGSKQLVGKAASVEFDNPCTFGAFCKVLRPKFGLEKYLGAFFQSNTYRQRISALSIGANINNIRNEHIDSLVIPLHNDEIRKSAIKEIDLLKGIIRKRKTILQSLDLLIKARFVEMFEAINDYCEVEYYIEGLIAGKSLAGEDECENKVLKTGAVSLDYFDASQVKNLPIDYIPQEEHLVNNGDIVISRMNTEELTGAAAYVWDVPEKVYLPDRLWKAELVEGCNPIFVWQMLIQPSTKEQIRRECSGTSGSMKNISKSGMLGIKVKKVPEKAQNKFAHFVKQVDKSKFCILNREVYFSCNRVSERCL